MFFLFLYKAIQTLPVTHREGKLFAYKLLCSIGVFNYDVSPSSTDFLDMFLLIIYQCLLFADEVEDRIIILKKMRIIHFLCKKYYLCDN